MSPKAPSVVETFFTSDCRFVNAVLISEEDIVLTSEDEMDLMSDITVSIKSVVPESVPEDVDVPVL